MERIMLLGVPLDSVTQSEALARIRTMLAGSVPCQVATPNSEMLVAAAKDPAFHALLNRTALNLPDSMGLVWAARQLGHRLPERVTGVDTVLALCLELDAASPVFLLGAAEGIAEHAAAMLLSRNPRLIIAGTYAGSPRETDAPAILERINASGARLVLVAYGAPAQELWIHRYLPQMPSVRVAIGVGGTFDFLAAVKKRAPRWMQHAGLEWFFRFIQEPSRWRRMWNAVIVFPWLVLRGAISPPR